VIRRGVIVVVAWALRRGIEPADMMRVLRTSFRRRDGSWRFDVLSDAINRNQPREIDA
jgi:hypothetical protein